MKSTRKWAVLGVCVLLLIGSFLLGRNSIKMPKATVLRDTVTVVQWDTLLIEKPIPIKETITKEKVVYVDVEKHDTLYLPREEKIFAKDSVYKCQVSGVDPRLDWIEVYPKTSYKTITEKEIQVIDRRFSFSIQGGVGCQYGLINKQFDIGPYLGIGIGCRF